MTAVEQWRDVPGQTSTISGFDIFTDKDRDIPQGPTTRTSAADNRFLQPSLAVEPQTSRETPSKTSEPLGTSRRNSFPNAVGKPPKSTLPKLNINGDSTQRLRSSQAADSRAFIEPEQKMSLERQSTPKTQQSSTPFSLWDYLQVELAATDSDEAHDFKRERVKNFLILPDALERTLMFGFIVCLDSFLYIFTILPIRFVRSTCNLCMRLLRSRISLQSSEKVDILKGILIILTCIVLNQLDASRIYHNIRGQAAIKLYVLYNVLEIGDKLFCALGQDILDCLFSKSTFGRKEDGTRRHLRPLAFLVLALAYNVLHTVLLFYQLVTLNVTVNSFSNALMTLLLSNQFVEIKGSVFKKFEKEGLFQITCADMVERFQLFLMLTIIGLRNTFEMSPTTPLDILTVSLGPLVTVLGSEVLVDWLKHAFITKFNHVRPTIYARFTDVLCRDYVKSAGTEGRNTFVDQSPAISRRIGLPVLPLVCLTIRSAGQIIMMVLEKAEVEGSSSSFDGYEQDFAHSVGVTQGIAAGTNHWWFPVWTALTHSIGFTTTTTPSHSFERTMGTIACTFCIIALVTLSLIILKLSIGISLIRFAHARYATMSVREDAERALETERKRRDVYKGIVEVDGDTKRMLNSSVDNLVGMEKSRGLAGLERYSMVSKRIY